MTLVNYIDYWYQPIREEYSPSFFTCQLLPLIIIFHPPSPINHILSSLFSFHPQTAMIQRVYQKRESIFEILNIIFYFTHFIKSS